MSFDQIFELSSLLFLSPAFLLHSVSRAGWAKNVVVGRARLGGLPVGVIAVETRTTETRIPSDPADLGSKVDVISNPGQVWFPNSAFKTAQAIKDMNKEQLPLMIFANWRGFSGTNGVSLSLFSLCFFLPAQSLCLVYSDG